ncbi:ABC transporter permease subunit [Dehalococcoidia bacterium]|nr:ABC transporter permease subunit [Dehalococcoidia bacterium]
MSTVRPGATSASHGRVRVPMVSAVGIGLLSVVSWTYIIFSDTTGFSDLFRSETWREAGEFIRSLASVGNGRTPAFLDLGSWRHALFLALETLTMSVLAIGFAGIAVLATFMPAARNVAFGELSGSRSPVGGLAFLAIRAALAFTRGVPELLWAMLIVFVLVPGVLPGAMALGIHNYGILGKLSAEVVEDLDPRPASALRTAGAGTLQMLAYGVLPQVLPQFVTYLLYRWEVVIRTTIVVGFVAAGGLGREFRLSMSWFQYDQVTLLLLCYLMLVLGVDLLAAVLRRLAR